MENNIGELTKFLRGAIITMLYNSVIKRGLKMSNEEKNDIADDFIGCYTGIS